ncbi:MAG: hypothetical protein M3Y19_00590 [Actinomycetota bacterium]|nr:hypothetical protein [Actinomycetota bacterium]
MSVATTDEQRAVQESIRAWAANTQPQAALREEDATSVAAERILGLPR